MGGGGSRDDHSDVSFGPMIPFTPHSRCKIHPNLPSYFFSLLHSPNAFGGGDRTSTRRPTPSRYNERSPYSRGSRNRTPRWRCTIMVSRIWTLAGLCTRAHHPTSSAIGMPGEFGGGGRSHVPRERICPAPLSFFRRISPSHNIDILPTIRKVARSWGWLRGRATRWISATAKTKLARELGTSQKKGASHPRQSPN